MSEIKFPKVARISYTPTTLAAAIAKNVRLERDEPLKDMSHYQGSWGSVAIEKLLDESNKLEIETQEKDSWSDTVYKRKLIGVACPTTGCIAGYAAVLSGDVMLVKAGAYEGAMIDIQSGVDPNEIEDLPSNEVYIPKEKRVQNIEDRAGELLKLDEGEKLFLFNGERTTEQVLDMLDAISSGGRVNTSSFYVHTNNGHGRAMWVESHYDDNNEWVRGHYANHVTSLVEGCSWCVEDLKRIEAEKWLQAEREYKHQVERWLRKELEAKINEMYSADFRFTS